MCPQVMHICEMFLVWFPGGWTIFFRGGCAVGTGSPGCYIYWTKETERLSLAGSSSFNGVLQSEIDSFVVAINHSLDSLYSGGVLRRLPSKTTVRPSLKLKIEDTSVFVGLRMQFSLDGIVLFSQSPNADRDYFMFVTRFQSWFTCRPYQEKEGAVRGLILSAADRCLNSDTASVFRHLFMDFSFVGFPKSVIQRAVKKVLLKHPYLRGFGLHWTCSSLVSLPIPVRRSCPSLPCPDPAVPCSFPKRAACRFSWLAFVQVCDSKGEAASSAMSVIILWCSAAVTASVEVTIQHPSVYAKGALSICDNSR